MGWPCPPKKVEFGRARHPLGVVGWVDHVTKKDELGRARHPHVTQKAEFGRARATYSTVLTHYFPRRESLLFRSVGDFSLRLIVVPLLYRAAEGYFFTVNRNFIGKQLKLKRF